MRKKQLILALVVMLALACISLMTVQKENSADLNPGDNVFSAVKIENLEKIVFNSTNAKAETELIEKDNKWLVKNRYEMDSDPSVIRKLFKAVSDAKAIHVVNHTEEDLKLFLLSDENTVKVSFYEKGKAEPIKFRLGKSHSFKEEATGRYVYIEDKKALVLVDLPLAFVAGQSNVWLKKFLPYHEQVAGVAFYSGSTILWKTERASSKLGFSLPLPKGNTKDPKEINELMFYAMQMRFMDIVPATNDFTIDPSLKDMALYYGTFSGRTYKLSFLKKEKNLLRCSISLISNKVETQFHKEYGSDELIKEELSEWHFTVPYKFYEMLYKL